MKQLSIIILTWNQLDTTRRCLESLRTFVADADTEIIVVDNGSRDGTASWLMQTYPQVRLVINSKNQGVAYARNRAIEKAQGRYILILDNDTVSNDEAIYGMMHYMDQHPQVGLCACRLTDVDGVVQESFKPFPSLSIKMRNVLGGSQMATSIEVPGNPIEPVYVLGACQMLRKSVLYKVGLLDENIFYGPEDADYCLRIAGEGFKVVYLPQYSIVHLWRRATNRQLFSLLAWKHFCGLCYFYIKHKRID